MQSFRPDKLVPPPYTLSVLRASVHNVILRSSALPELYRIYSQISHSHKGISEIESEQDSEIVLSGDKKLKCLRDSDTFIWQ